MDNKFFKSKNITENIIAIEDITGVYMYLVLGLDKAILIDTGTGAGNLYEYVNTLTELPIEVILTHGHCDHAGGAKYFDKVYLPEEDFELVKIHASMKRKVEYIHFSGGENVDESDVVGERTLGYTKLENGQIFDLGNEQLEMIKLPGHTKGMTCVLFKNQRIILLGDGCNPATFIWDEESLPVSKLLDNLMELKNRENEYDTVLVSHGNPICDKGILDGVIDVCREVLTGKDDAVPFHFMDYEGLKMAKRINPATFQREDGGIGNIVYNIKKIS